MKKSMKKIKRTEPPNLNYQLKTFELHRGSESILQQTFKKEERNQLLHSYLANSVKGIESPKTYKETFVGTTIKPMKKSSSRKTLNKENQPRRSSVGPKLSISKQNNAQNALTKQIQQLQIIMKGPVKKKIGESPSIRLKETLGPKPTVSRNSLLVKQSKTQKQLPPLDLFPLFKNTTQSPPNQKQFVKSFVNSSKNSSKGQKEDKNTKAMRFQDFKTLSKQLKPPKLNQAVSATNLSTKKVGVSDRFKYEIHNNYYNTKKTRSGTPSMNQTNNSRNITKQYDILLKKIQKIGQHVLSPKQLSANKSTKNSAKNKQSTPKNDDSAMKSTERKERKPTKKMFNFIKESDDEKKASVIIYEDERSDVILQSRKSSLDTLIYRNDNSSSKKEDSIKIEEDIPNQIGYQPYFKTPEFNPKIEIQFGSKEAPVQNVKTNNLISLQRQEEKVQQLALAEQMRKNFQTIEEERQLKRNLDSDFVETNLFEQESVATQINQSVLDLDFYPSQMQEEKSVINTEPSMLVNSQLNETGTILTSLDRQFEMEAVEVQGPQKRTTNAILELDQNPDMTIGDEEDFSQFQQSEDYLEEDESKIQCVSELNIEDLY